MKRRRRFLLSVACVAAAAASVLVSVNPATAAARPVISKLSATSGPLAGGTRVKITGKNFTQVTKVVFGSTAGTQLKVASGTAIYVTAPRHAAGTVNVEVVAKAGTSAAIAADRFSYISPPSVTKLVQASGSVEGGTRVQIGGANFLKVSKVLFGGKAGTQLKVASPTLIFVTAPPAASFGQVDIRVVTAYGTSPVTKADHYTYALPAAALTWTAPIDAFSSLDAVSCPTTTFCAAVGGGMNAVTYHSGTWSAPVHLPGALQPNSVSCTSATFCLAGDRNGQLWRYDGANWMSEPSPPGTTAVASLSCASPAFCAMLSGDSSGSFSEIALYKDSAWTLFQAPGYWRSVSCASSSFCAAVGSNGTWATYNGTSWSISSGKGPGEDSGQLTCVSATFCVAADIIDVLVIFNGKTWSGVQAGDHTGQHDSAIPQIVSVSCSSSTFCVASDSDNAVYTFDGRWWSASSSAGMTNLRGVSCASPTFCVAVSADGHAAIGT